MGGTLHFLTSKGSECFGSIVSIPSNFDAHSHHSSTSTSSLSSASFWSLSSSESISSESLADDFSDFSSDGNASDYANNDCAELEASLSQIFSVSRKHTCSPSVRQHVAHSQSYLEDSAGFDTEDENVVAAIREDLVKVGKLFAGPECDAFRDRAQVLASINYLARHVPGCVLDHLGQELRTLGTQKHIPQEDHVTRNTTTPSLSDTDSDGDWDWDWESSKEWADDDSASSLEEQSRTSFYSASSRDGKIVDLPYVAPFQGVVVFVDISGFTELSSRLGSENVSTALNTYFERVIRGIFEFDGDIQKFAGDALFAEWRVTSKRSMERCATLAAICTCKLAKELTDFRVEVVNGRTVDTVQMNCHFGLGIGGMVGIHIGDNECRRQYLYVGDPIVQATDACNLAAPSEVVISAKFHTALSLAGYPPIIIARDQGNGKITIEPFGDDFDTNTWHVHKRPADIAMDRAITRQVEGLGLETLKEYRRLIALYCHPVVRFSRTFDRGKAITSSHGNRVLFDEESEMRNVFVAFLNAPIPWQGSADRGMVNRDAVHQINQVFNLVSQELLHFNGYVESFIDDKGFSLMITFGLRGSTFPNLVSAVALPAILKVKEVINSQANVKCHIGSTYGNVHCGFLGSSERHEYTVLGPSVNLAARLMTSSLNAGVLVDQSVQRIACDPYTFEPIGEVTAKGYCESIMTYTPVVTGTNEELPPRHSCDFVGRQRELEVIRNEAEIASGRSKMLLISGASGVGKSTLLSQATTDNNLTRIAEGVLVEKEHFRCDPKSSFIPYAGLLPFLQSVLKLSDLISFCQAKLTADHKLFPIVMHILDSPSQTNKVYQNLLILDQKDLIALSHCVCQLLSQRIRTADRFIIFIDDCHRLDAFSWRTLGMLLKENSGLFLIGTATTSSLSGFRMDEETKDLIFEMFLRTGQLTILELECLLMGDVATLISKALDVNEVSDELLHSVYAESGGNPLFINQVLDRLKGSPTADPYDDLIVHRLDCFSCDKRHCLAVASCFGTTFSAEDIRQIFLAEGDEFGAENSASTLEALAQLNVLRANSAGALGSTVCYSFRDDRWRKKILDITLKSAQRDVTRLVSNQRCGINTTA